MRKLCLTFVATAAVLSAGALTANAMTPAGVSGIQAAVNDSGLVHQARTVCTHRWNGRYHRHRRCFWVRGHRR